MKLIACVGGGSAASDVVVDFPLRWVRAAGVQGVHGHRRSDGAEGVYYPVMCRFVPVDREQRRDAEQEEAERALFERFHDDPDAFYAALLYAACGVRSAPVFARWCTVDGQSRTARNVVAVASTLEEEISGMLGAMDHR